MARPRWTKRPQNYCGSCGYSWYPRGSNRSAGCPRCGSRHVKLGVELFFEMIAAAVMITARCVVAATLAVVSAMQWLFRSEHRRRVADTVSTAYRKMKAVATSALLWFGNWLIEMKTDAFERPLVFVGKLLILAVALFLVCVLGAYCGQQWRG